MSLLNGFGLFGSESLVVAPAPGAVPRPEDVPAPVGPREERVATADVQAIAPARRLDAYRSPYGWHSAEKYEWMLDTPAVSASFEARRAAILQNKIDLLPVTSLADAKRLDQESDAPAVGQLDAATAAMVVENNKRIIHLMETPLDLVLFEKAEAEYLGHVISEVTMGDVVGGPDDGLWYVRRVRPLPRGAARFVVDAQMNVIGIRARVSDGRGGTVEETLDPAHFWWMTYNPYRADPRGRSIFRPAVHAWEQLLELWPEALKGSKQYGTPMTVGILGPDAKDVPQVDKDGKAIPGKGAIPALKHFAMQIARLLGGSTIAVDAGSDVKVVESRRDATSVATQIAVYEDQIVKAILLTTRATVEAKHGSRADSQTAQDVTGTIIRFDRKWMERNVRDLLRRVNELNYGPEVARLYTPLVDLGSTEHQDFSQMASAVAALVSAGYFAEDQFPGLDNIMGFGMREIGAQRVGPNGPIPTVAQAEQAAKDAAKLAASGGANAETNTQDTPADATKEAA